MWNREVILPLPKLVFSVFLANCLECVGLFKRTLRHTYIGSIVSKTTLFFVFHWIPADDLGERTRVIVLSKSVWKCCSADGCGWFDTTVAISPPLYIFFCCHGAKMFCFSPRWTLAPTHGFLQFRISGYPELCHNQHEYYMVIAHSLLLKMQAGKPCIKDFLMSSDMFLVILLNKTVVHTNSSKLLGNDWNGQTAWTRISGNASRWGQQHWGSRGHVALERGQIPWAALASRLEWQIFWGGWELCQHHGEQHSRVSEHSSGLAVGWDRRRGQQTEAWHTQWAECVILWAECVVLSFLKG